MKTCAEEGSIGVGGGSAGVEEAEREEKERGDNGNVGLNFSTAAAF